VREAESVTSEISLSSLAPISWKSIEQGDAGGFCLAHAPRRISRSSKYFIATEFEDERIARLRSLFADPSYISAELGFGRLRDVLVDCQYGLCMSSAGSVIQETAYMPKLIDGAMNAIPLLKSAKMKLEYERVAPPVLHCFHRSTAAYGYFIFDALAAIALCRETILSGLLKLLMPGFLPKWIEPILARAGIREEHIIRPGGKVAFCADIVVANLMDCRNTFRPNPEICRGIADLAAHRKGEPSHRGSHIYISRRNQRSKNDRFLENEPDVEQLFATKGYTIIEPGNLSFAAQTAIFRKAEVIVGPHGSAFGNLVFAQPGASVIDLMPADWIGFRDGIGTRERWLLNATTALNLDYTVIVCPSRVVDDPARTRHGKKPIVYAAPLELLEEATPCGKFFNRFRATINQWR
jgi:capsular polysaccharide biosynthesis protein